MTTINRAPWNALVDDPGNNMEGTPWNKAAIKGVLLDPIDASLATLDTANATQDTKLGLINTGAWLPYTPTWQGLDAVGPTLGNGQLQGRYVVFGKTCHFAIFFKPGTTTTFGTSTYWTWTLPLPATAAIAVGGGTNIAGFVNAGGSPSPPGATWTVSATQFYVVAQTGGLVNPSVPFIWSSTNCQMMVRGTYELA